MTDKVNTRPYQQLDHVLKHLGHSGYVVTELPVTDEITLSTPPGKEVEVLNAPVMQCVGISGVDVQRRLLRYQHLFMAKAHILETITGLEQQVFALNDELDLIGAELSQALMING